MCTHASDGRQRLNLRVLEAGDQQQQVALLIDERTTVSFRSQPARFQLLSLYVTNDDTTLSEVEGHSVRHTSVNSALRYYYK